MTDVVRRASIRRAPSQPDSVKPVLYICTPCYGCQAMTPYIASLRQLTRSLDQAGIVHTVELLGNESLITRARNKCVAQFLKTNASHLVFIDADVGFRPGDLAAMIRANYDVVVGAYPMKSLGWGNIEAAVRSGEPTDKLAKAGALYAVNPYVADMQTGRLDVQEREGAKFVRVEDGATGFMVIKREAIERFISHYRASIEYVTDYEPIGETHHMVFQADRDPKALAEGKPARYLSEDYWFCRMWQMMGGEVYLNIDAQLTHTGTYRFEGDVGLLFEVDGDEAEVEARAPEAEAQAAPARDYRHPAGHPAEAVPAAAHALAKLAEPESYESGRPPLPDGAGGVRGQDRYADLPVSFVEP